ncbi:MAG TPA: phosphoesterase [Thermotogaceae bacterium]|nr:phosphoesterase [Thermotogaceae bacterium]
MGKNALINGFYKEGVKIAPSCFYNELQKKYSGRRILHITHVNPDCDGVASLYWGLRVFGGDFLLSGLLSRSVINLLNFLEIDSGFREIDYENYDVFFIYDTEKAKTLDYIDLNKKDYILFDHHPTIENDLILKAKFSYITVNSANVVNLFEFSKMFDIVLDEKILFAFACGLFTDTGMLRTARKKELNYLAEFIGDKRIEDVMEILYSKSLEDASDFLKRVSMCSIHNICGLKIATMNFQNNEEFFAFVDGLFKILDIDVLIGDLPEGIKIYLKKKHSQKIYNRIIIPFQKKYKLSRDHATLLGFHDSNRLIKELKENL